MTIKIRPDFKDVERLIAKLIVLGQEFSNKDSDWSHMKNKEDWERNLYEVSDPRKRAVLEKLYCDGRDMGIFMAHELVSINHDISSYPTISSVVDRFNDTWVHSDLDYIVKDAQAVVEEYQLNCWAFRQMVKIFREQQKLASVVKATLSHLKQSDLYKMENGIPMNKDKPSIYIESISNSQNVSIASDNVNQVIEQSDAIFEELLKKIEELDIDQKEAIRDSVKAMQATNGTPEFKSAYNRFINSVATHITVFSPFIPALSQLL